MPKVINFKVFDCDSLAHNPYEKHKILQPMSQKYIFVSYDEDVRGYCLFVPWITEVILGRGGLDEHFFTCKTSSSTLPSSICESTSHFSMLTSTSPHDFDYIIVYRW